MRRFAGQGAGQIRRSSVHRPTGKLKQIARSLFEPPVTEAEAQAAGFELEDYPEPEIIEVWPDNEAALDIAMMIGTRWVYPAMGGVPLGVRWEAIYPLMDRRASGEAWDELHEYMMVIEAEALATLREFAPKERAK
ncbi:DUF1799 domain-containing protein [Comamonas koreensis]|uniref:DUF1799 domain-containing protein n=1 Tax=Comamonas koreensis TaxID=160825 RepID=UPI0022B7800B|nr:DUF1799 domain-containing protein [Comamonas koreensis]